jgi:hypothetical protein
VTGTATAERVPLALKPLLTNTVKSSSNLPRFSRPAALTIGPRHTVDISGSPTAQDAVVDPCRIPTATANNRSRPHAGNLAPIHPDKRQSRKSGQLGTSSFPTRMCEFRLRRGEPRLMLVRPPPPFLASARRFELYEFKGRIAVAAADIPYPNERHTVHADIRRSWADRRADHSRLPHACSQSWAR